VGEWNSNHNTSEKAIESAATIGSDPIAAMGLQTAL